MIDHRTILNRVGTALIAFGIADIAVMIYCMSNNQSCSSGFNILAVIAGMFLLRGNLGATRLITWLSAFKLAYSIGTIVLLVPFSRPVDLLVIEMKLNPVFSALAYLMAVIAFVLLGWTYYQLRSEPVLTAIKASGRTTAAPKLAFGLGLALVAVLTFTLNMTLNGGEGAKAIELARQQLGPDYNYTTQSILSGNGHGSAIVIAYNDEEIKYIAVEWSE